MQSRRLYLAVAAAVAVAALAISATAAGGSAKRANGGGGHGQLISESALLAGLAQGLFPFLDTTPNTITRTHIAITDSTVICSAGEAPPANIQVLVGQAGEVLTNVMTAATNTGIGTARQCVFHVTARPGEGGVPDPVTDVVVTNAGGAPLTGINTITASATVRRAH